MKNTPETLKVLPIDREKLKSYLLHFVKLKENEILDTFKDAIYNDITTDTDCCYSYSLNKLHEGEIKLVVDVPIYINKKTETGRIISMSPDYYISIPVEKLKEFCKPETTLKDFMGGRFNYNPRIIANTRNLIAVINDSIVEN